MTLSGQDHEQPLEAQVPPAVVATPSELRAGPDDAIRWWRPGWNDAVQFVGWRWLLLSPALILLAMLVGAIFFQRWRFMLLVLGAKLMVFVGAVSLSLAGWVVRRAARARKEPFCIHCGYNLTGLPDNYRCPECGRAYNWRLIEEYRRDPQWFIDRWKMHHELPSADTPFEAGSVRRKPRDGTA
jgi:predicted RNA-binding Zn-ribbon protein involved in translation (DUF1610 family)